MTHLRFPVSLVVLAVALGAAGAARAQPADSLGAAPARAVIPFGRALTYAEIAREYARLRPIPRPDSVARSGDPFLGIQGLVVDETATPAGRLFYDAFFFVWRPPPAVARSTVALSEQPLPGNSTAILIRVDGELAFQARLPRRQEEVEELATQAAQFVASRLGG